MTSFVNALDVEQQETSARDVQVPTRRAFGLGVVAGGLACAGLAAVAFFQTNAKDGANHEMVEAFAPTGFSASHGRASAPTQAVKPVQIVSMQAPPIDEEAKAEQRKLIKEMVTAKDGTAMRAAVSMMAKNTKMANEFCYGLPGALPPAGNFDPAGLSQKPEMDVRYYREAELTHGRVGMLASLGFLVQEQFHPLFTADGGPAIEQIPRLPPALWFGMTLGIGICESIRIQAGFANPFEGAKPWSIKPGYTPGDLGFDPLGLKPSDPEEFKEMQLKELQNGRLAMIAAAGFMAQEAVSGTTWSQADIVQGMASR